MGNGKQPLCQYDKFKTYTSNNAEKKKQDINYDSPRKQETKGRGQMITPKIGKAEENLGAPCCNLTQTSNLGF